MKQITLKQIETIINAFYQVNAPVQMYAQVKDMLEKLPNVTPEAKPAE